MSRPARYEFKTRPVARSEATVAGDKWRFSVLTDGLLRYEWAEDGKFEDRASTFAINRELAVPDTLWFYDHEHSIEIVTNRFHVVYDKKWPSDRGFSVSLKGPGAKRWTYGQLGSLSNLGGTRRTLDTIDGRAEIGPGVLSRDGIAVVDDTNSMLFEKDGWIGTRREGIRIDMYLFVYGRDYRAAMRAFHAISGSQPLLPRFALGNWWSRYHRYSADEYLSLMNRFDKEEVPISVATVDMDWHLVDIDPKYGSGWTGYTWNLSLFPDPLGFMKELHDRKHKVTLNVHPADGIRAHEKQYPAVAKYMGIDPATEQPVHFDCTDKKFMDAYFDIVHHEHEKDGVDFWWIDWQQGDRSRLPGVDPLWVLNHFHFLDNGRNQKRPLILSRFGGPGSQRYQIGFSGDTQMTWKSLEFQPEFTATSSNIGYGWWSHDIGGHYAGYKDDELTTRWVQLGCFSPILRLHSSANIFNTKEPWAFNKEACEIMKDTLRFRQRLIPYLYTMNARSASDDEPLVQPMYWDYPDREEAYGVRNQFRFGSELIVAPITSPRDPSTHHGVVKAWLPPKRYVDIFTGVVYDGDREMKLHRTLDRFPVLAAEGAIVPLDGSWRPANDVPNPTSIEILLVVGADGAFNLIEDNGSGTHVDDGDFRMIEDDGVESGNENVRFSYTPIIYKQSTGVLTIGPTSPTDPSIPESRTYTVRLVSYTPRSSQIRCVTTAHKTKKAKIQSWTTRIVENGTLVDLGAVSNDQTVILELEPGPQLDVLDPTKMVWTLLKDANMEYDRKVDIWNVVTAGQAVETRVSRLRNMGLRVELVDAIVELLLADGRYD
ncbi:glycoside hydrolase family 31 protein [Sporormia fimetaria CBS 119925]|uniref:alpha-glucosidase n=1 Tax=Sporormia fimetaria CBS 119925 TaxID=1340428 RepID=A0A6A6VI32_9PLEO|nr:glycoside hydrolase family 31 protein [Sporormia fimetaria CBS 119925]